MIKEYPIGQRSLEGKYITGRKLIAYEYLLDLNSRSLEGKKVLNFGSGRSRLIDNLKQANIDTQLIDVDLFLNPLKNSSGDIRDNAVQADGVALPFKDNTFDEVLALWSTYQIPLGKRKKVFAELLRVGKTVRIAPIIADEDRELLLSITDKYPDTQVTITDIKSKIPQVTTAEKDEYVSALEAGASLAIIQRP